MESVLQYFSSPLVSITITILGLLLGTIGIYYTRKYRIVRRLFVSDWDNREILNLATLEERNIRIIHQEREVSGLHELRVTLKNRGTAVLKDSDFFQKPTVNFISDIKILDAEAICSEDYIDPRIEVRDSTVVLNIGFLEPKDEITLKILYGSRNVTGGTIRAKIVGGNKLSILFKTNKEYQAYRAGKLIGKSIYMFSTFLFAFFMLYVLSRFGVLEEVTTPFLFLLLFFVFGLSALSSLIIGSKIQDKIERGLVQEMIEKGELEAQSQKKAPNKNV